MHIYYMKIPFYRFLLIGVISLITFSSKAQQEVLFKVQYLPEKMYKSHMVNTTAMEMNFKGDSAKLKQMASNGLKLPMQMELVQNMDMVTKTGAIRTDKQIPITVNYDKVVVSQKLNGKEMPYNDMLSGIKIEGRTKDGGQILIDSIYGNLPSAMKKVMADMVQNMQKSIVFPSHPLKVGDKFSQEAPMAIPLGKTPMKMVVKMNYTLKEVKDQKAYFDLSQFLTLDFSIKEANADATGQGIGSMVYDLKSNFIISSDSNINMDLKMSMGADMSMVATGITKSSVSVTIE